MTAIAKTAPSPLAGIDQDTMTALMAGGDCSRLTPAQRNAYYVARCEVAGLDARAQPFQFVRLNGKEVLYATKAATDQLAGKHGIVCNILSQVTEQGLRVVTVRATAKDGRSQEDIGAVNVEGLKGEALANAYMKAITKAKRRTILSLTGLGMLDESELESIPDARPVEPRPVAKVVEVVDAGPLSPGVDPPSMDEPPPEEEGKEEEWTEASAMRVRIRACKTMGQLLLIGKEIGTDKALTPADREALRADYAARRAELSGKAGGES